MGFSNAQAENIVRNVHRDGYLEQSIDYGNYHVEYNYLVTDWSKLQPLTEANDEEQGIFLCLIAAQMLEYGMTKAEYLNYLNEKGLMFDLKELYVPTPEGEIPVSILTFSKRTLLILEGDPITYVKIQMESPFLVHATTCLAIDISENSTPYWIMTDDGQKVPEPKINEKNAQ